MILKIYTAIWAFVALAAAMFFLTGNFSEMTAVIFGFTVFGMVFMGMLSVLPATVAHPAAPKEKRAKSQPAAAASLNENKNFAPGDQVPVH